jgi:hypothetical protein
VAARSSRVLLDLNSPEFQAAFLTLESAELKQAAAVLARLRGLDWDGVYRHPGLQWEALAHATAPNGARVYSFRLSQKMRAVAYRDGDFLVVASLHPDHDSAYRR